MQKDSICIQKKTAENEYTSYLTENENGIVISMVYKNGSSFPSEIRVFKDGQLAVGTITPYREKTQTYDIIWYMDNQVETFSDISLSKDINTSNNFSNLDTKLKYQVDTIKNSLLIWQSIDKYNSSSSPNTYSIMARGWFDKLIGAFIGIIAIAIAVFIPVVIPAVAAIGGTAAATVVGIGMAGTSAAAVTVANELIYHSDEKTEEKKDENDKLINKQSIVNIVNNDNNNLIQYDDFIKLDADTSYNRLNLNIQAIQNSICNGLVSIEVMNTNTNDTNYYANTRKYFVFDHDGIENVVKSDYSICNINIDEKSSKLFTIRKLNNITDKKDDKEIYLVFTFNDNNIKINNRVGNKFRIRIN
ncbi:lysis protein [Brachyspira sp.]|uniref:lysis protein n=1 Tax=Brachyspira sp. TaxID=1977261 RepID=UPI002622B840|nr:lysis protein [Brachyspira sp.]